MRIIVKCGSRKYDLIFDKRISVITGNSGIGKTILIDDMKLVLDNNGGDILREIPDSDFEGDYVYSDMSLYFPSDIQDAENRNKKLEDYLFIVDENFSGIRKQHTADIISKSGIRFLIVTRTTTLTNITFGLNSLYSIYEDSGVVSLLLYTHKTFVKSNSQITPMFILTEDSTEGKFIFDLYTKNIRVESCNGKYNIVNTISELEDYLERGEFVLSVDMCAIGSTYESVALDLENMGFESRVNQNYLSLEKLILDSLCSYKIKYNEYSNELEEGFYEGMLNHVMIERYGIPYVKGTIPSLMLFTSIYKSFRKYYYFIPDKNIRERNILLEELLRFIENDKRLSKLFKAIRTNINSIEKFTNEEFIIMDIIVDMFVNKDIKHKTLRISKLDNKSTVLELLSDNNFSVKEVKRDNMSLHMVIDNSSMCADEFIRKFS